MGDVVGGEGVWWERFVWFGWVDVVVVYVSGCWGGEGMVVVEEGICVMMVMVVGCRLR